MQNRKVLLGSGIAGVLSLDILTKWLAQRYLLAPIEFLPFWRLEFTENSNLAFGIPFPRGLTVLLSIFAVIFLGNLFVKNVRKSSKIGVIAFALIFGGAIGNLGERILFGRVTDFVYLIGIPNFNLADAALSAGVVLLIIFYSKIFVKN
ncbi:MAG: signal peptidase II [Patescibacteria group bacterium]